LKSRRKNLLDLVDFYSIPKCVFGPNSALKTGGLREVLEQAACVKR